jgi:hypothetical protein
MNAIHEQERTRTQEPLRHPGEHEKEPERPGERRPGEQRPDDKEQENEEREK